MNVYASNRVSESDCSTGVGLLRHPVFAIAVIAGGLNISAARADNTRVQANMTFSSTASCDLDNCTTANGSVTIDATCDATSCDLTTTSSFDVDCAPSNNDPTSLVLIENQTNDCTGDGTQVDLLAASPTLSRLKWDEMAKSALAPRALGDWIIVANLGPLDGGGNAIASGNPRAVIVPTLSEWGVVWMAMLLLVAGTIVIRRSHRLARAA